MNRAEKSKHRDLAHDSGLLPIVPRLIVLSLVTLTLLVCPESAEAETVFSLNPATDISLGSASIGLFGVSQLFDPRIEPQTPREGINVLDSVAMFRYRPVLDRVGTYATYAVLLAPTAMVLFENGTHDRALSYATMYSEALLLTYGTKDLLKALVSRHRPYTYFGPVPEGEEDDYANSFPSGHTSLAFLGAAFLATTFASEYPDSPYVAPVVTGSFAVAAGVAATRVLSGSHFVTDVLAGAAIGTFWGWLIPRLHR